MLSFVNILLFIFFRMILMRNNKFIFLALIFLVSFVCISAVSAADDADSSNIAADANNVTVLEESIDDESISDSQSDENVLSNDEENSEPLKDSSVIKSFTDLKNDVVYGSDTVYLDADYLYHDGDDIVPGSGVFVNRPVTVYGNGHIIDGNNKSCIFFVNTHVVFHDIVFKNAKYDGQAAWGAAISGRATAINCTFIGNSANGDKCYGGAMSDGTAINCTFIDNRAGNAGGAINNVTATNCTFIGNEAENGGAAYSSNATNCVFIANHASIRGGAMHGGNANNCIFLSNSANEGKDLWETTNINCIFAESAALSVSDFSTVPYSGEKQMITLTGNGGELLNNVPVTVKITKDGVEIANYSGLSGDGWAVNLSPGKYNATFTVDYANVEPATCAIRITSGRSFTDLDYLINKKYAGNTTIYLDIDYESDSDDVGDSVVINRNLTIDGNGHTLNGSDRSRIFRVTDNAVVTFKNIIFTHGFTAPTGYGGAIWADGSTVKAIKCNFTYNQANFGGAIANGDAEDCYFAFNKANQGYNYDGGAIYKGNAVNCTFIGNEAENGGAIYMGDAVNSCFIGNNATYGGGAIYEGDATDCIFESNNARTGGGAICNGNAVNSCFIGNNASYGGAMNYGEATDCIFESNYARDNGGAIYDGNAFRSNFTSNNATGNGTAMYAPDDYPCRAVNCIFTNNNGDGKEVIYNCFADSCFFIGDTPGDHATVLQPVLNVANFTSNYNDGSVLVVIITTHSGMLIDDANIKVDVYTTAGAFVGTYNIKSGGWVVPLNAGSYIAKYNATDYDNVVAQGNIVVNKVKSAVTSQAVSTVYNKGNYLVINLKDSKGEAISDASVSVTLDGAKTYKTDKNGQIKINIAKLTPKTYTSKISFAGNANYLASSATAKVVVKKATPKMTAKKKTFKKSTKTKKYAIVLKDNTGKAIKKAKIGRAHV